MKKTHLPPTGCTPQTPRAGPPCPGSRTRARLQGRGGGGAPGCVSRQARLGRAADGAGEAGQGRGAAPEGQQCGSRQRRAGVQLGSHVRESHAPASQSSTKRRPEVLQACSAQAGAGFGMRPTCQPVLRLAPGGVKLDKPERGGSRGPPVVSHRPQQRLVVSEALPPSGAALGSQQQARRCSPGPAASMHSGGKT